MPAWLRALSFVFRAASGRAVGVVRRSAEIGEGPQALAIDVYEGPGPIDGTVLFVHGMTLHGHRDPRQVAACRALASSGLRVVAPLFTEIAEPRVDTASLERVGQAIRQVAARPELTPTGRLALFSASFSASLCMLAATRDDVARHIGVICALGAYADLHQGLRFAMGATDLPAHPADPYARLVLFRSLLHRVLGPIPRVEAALSVALADDSLRREPPLLPQVLAELDEVDRALVQRVLGDPAWCRDMAPRVLEASEDLVTTLDLLPQAGRLRCPVLLLHGQDDRVIPAEQSQALHARRAHAGLESRLLLTPLLSHGDTQWSLAAPLAALRLVDAFSWYFERVPGPRS